MDLIKMREQIMNSNDITVIAPKNVIAEIVLLIARGGNVSVSTNYDVQDDNVLMMSKLHIKNPKAIIETALFKDGKLNYNDGDKLLIEESSLETMKRLGVDKELIEGYRSFCVFKA
jgi:hypothetical protein